MPGAAASRLQPVHAARRHRRFALVVPTSARIGDARSTLIDGIISAANSRAAALGVVPGRRCANVVEAVAPEH